MYVCVGCRRAGPTAATINSTAKTNCLDGDLISSSEERTTTLLATILSNLAFDQKHSLFGPVHPGQIEEDGQYS